MAGVSPQRTDKPPNRPNTPVGPDGNPQPGAPTGQSWRWLWGVLAIGIVAVLLAVGTIKTTNSKSITYTKFMQDVSAKQVSTAQISNSSGQIVGKLKDGTSYTVQGPTPSLPNDVSTMRNDGVEVSFPTPSSNIFTALLPYLFIIGIGAAFIYFIGRQTHGQMSGIMSIGRSKAKTFSSDRPSTTFDDVAGYTGVKQEISEVVDFLKTPGRFKEIGAKIPKGVLLVGPPGTGKTLIARAVAGEAGVPFMSVSGSDFMEMFVGVGASRVRDLFQTARKQAPAIVFVDEIDSIGRKRGAGLGGGHDEREQTLNQMLSEMDGFDTSEGVVMIAATNRPDILDPALLRPGRFDRQIVVPLPDLEERLPILQVHCKGKRMADDVDLGVVSRGTPGMSGADLANLVNEAALHAVRRGSAGDRHGRLRDGARPGAARPAARVDGPLGGREGAHRVPRGRPRRAGLRARARRPRAQGDHPPDGHGARRHPPAPDGGASHPPPPVHRGLAVRAHGWPLRRAPRLRRPLHGRRQRPRRQHGAGPQDGARVGHERGHRADGLGIARARSSWARTSCTRATTPRTRPRSSTTRSSGSCAPRSNGPWRC